MRILVLGAGGMLGHQLCRTLADRMDIWGTYRDKPADYAAPFNALRTDRVIGQVEVHDTKKIGEILDAVKPDAVVNCVGIVKQRDEAKQAVPSIQVNAMFPHQLADLCSERRIRVVQISTDCVFSGFRGKYTELDVPDPVDLYGRTKLLGELNRPDAITLRTSIIGWQLNTFSSLLSWFALQRGKRVKGYKKAIYTGLTTAVLAQLIGDILETRPDLTGLYQVASESISKYDLLIKLQSKLGWDDIVIDHDDHFFCDRSLVGARFTTTTGWISPGWDEMIAGLAEEWPLYAPYYSTR